MLQIAGFQSPWPLEPFQVGPLMVTSLRRKQTAKRQANIFSKGRQKGIKSKAEWGGGQAEIRMAACGR